MMQKKRLNKLERIVFLLKEREFYLKQVNKYQDRVKKLNLEIKRCEK